MGHSGTQDMEVKLSLTARAPTPASLVPGALALTPSPVLATPWGAVLFTDALDVLSRAHLPRRMVSTFQNSLIILRLSGY